MKGLQLTIATSNIQPLYSLFQEMSTDIETYITTLKSLESPDLFKILKAVTLEVEKKTKKNTSTTTKTTTKKTSSMPKGAIPPQLKKPRAWVEFTLKNALENGWEPFTILQKKKDKETNTITEEQIEMPGSILHNGAYIYEDSINETHPDGRQIIHKEAMSLSKQRKESGHHTYPEFEEQYVEEVTDDDKSDAGSTTSKKIIVKKTAAEKEAETAAKKAEKEAEKEAKKAEKEAEKAEKKAQKEAEKAAAKEAKEAEKAEKKKKPVTKALVPAAAIATKTEAQVVQVTKKKVTEAQVAKKKKVVEEIPNDGMAHPWTYKGKNYLRNFEGETWTVGGDGGVGEWAGLYDAKTDKLDTSAEEPIYEDDE